LATWKKASLPRVQRSGESKKRKKKEEAKEEEPLRPRFVCLHIRSESLRAFIGSAHRVRVVSSVCVCWSQISLVAAKRNETNELVAC